MQSLLKLWVLAQAVLSAPLAARDDDTYDSYSQISPVFSLLAFHKGEEFRFNTVKYDGTNLKLDRDLPAFFGHIIASKNYALTVPNISEDPFDSDDSIEDLFAEANVTVSSSGELTAKSNQSSAHFGITGSFLTYMNSSDFIACPTWSLGNSTRGNHTLLDANWTQDHENLTAVWNRNASVADSWRNATLIYGHKNATNATWLSHFDDFALHFGSECPGDVPGYNVSLIVQVLEWFDYNPDQNSWEGFESEGFESDDESTDTSLYRRALQFFA